MTTIGGKQFINRGTSQNPIYQRAGSSASIVSGGTAIDGANVSTGTDAPESPADGDLWFNETVGSLFVYIDGTGWVESNPGGGGGGVGTVGYGGSSVNAKTEEFFYSDAAYTTPVLLNNATDGNRFYHKDGYIIVNLVYESSSNQSSNVDVTYYPPDSETGFIVGATKKSGGSGHGYDQNMTFAMAPGSSCQIGNTNFTCRAATVTLLDAAGGGASVTTSETAPTSPSSGDLWYDTSVSQLYTYVDDTGWLQSNGGSSGPRAYLTVNGFSGYAGGGYGGNTIITSHNISSITYGTPNTYYINFENPVTDPVVQVSHGSIQVDSSYEVADGESFCRIQLFTDASKTWWTGQVASNSEDFLSRYIVGGDVVRIGVRITQDGGLYKRVSPLFVTVH